jgi:hypothetical protein
MIGRLPMASFGRTSISVTSALFFVVGLMILGAKPVTLDAFNKTLFYGFMLFAYVTSTMLYVNSAYRCRVICKRLGMNRMERKISKIWEIIEDKFSSQEKDVDLLRYYFVDAFRLFEEGNYEMAFISGYKVINEKTVVDPKEHVSDKREGKPSSFSEIRTVLMHSRREKTQIDVRRIGEIKKKLPQYCLELLQRDFELLEKLAG